MTDKLEAGVADQMADVVFTACKEIVKTKKLIPFSNEPVTEMGSQKPGSTRYEDSFGHEDTSFADLLSIRFHPFEIQKHARQGSETWNAAVQMP